MASDADTRRYIIEQWQYLYGTQPTIAEVERHLAYLNTHTRTQWLAEVEKQRVPDAVARLYQQVLGRAPSDKWLAYWTQRIRSGQATRKSLMEHLSGSAEGLLRKPDEAPDPDAENARDYLSSVLKSYGLEGMGDWAWEQIQQGYTSERILQNLRETDTYKQRFVGMELRRQAGLPAISEGEYIAYETSARQMMRAAGMPADFYDQPQDFASWIGKDVSISELNTRISEGYAAAAQAPAEARAELKRLYGVDEGQLAAFFLDPDRALPIIQRQWTAAQLSGAAVRTSYGVLGQDEAERLAELGVSSEQAQEGFGQLAQGAELYGPMAGTDEEAIDRATQQSAVFAGDAAALATIERRVGARKSAASGAQSFTLGQDGVSALGR